MNEIWRKFLSELSLANAKVKHIAEPITLALGGQVGDLSPAIPVKSLRHGLVQTMTSYEIIYPEKIVDWLHDGIYKNLVSFEKDLAAICDLIVVIPESEGSIAELAAFSQLETLSKKMVVVATTEFAGMDSFINLGIFRFIRDLETDNNLPCVITYPWFINEPTTITPEIVQDLVNDLTEYFSATKSSNFNYENDAHILAIICELIGVLVALKFSEILDCLDKLGINLKRDELKRKLFLLKKFSFIDSEQYSDKYFYFLGEREFNSVSLSSKPGEPSIDKLRVTVLSLDYYKITNKERHRNRIIARNSLPRDRA